MNTSVAVVGLGYVGLPLALLASRKGLMVLGVDVSEKKVALINKGVSPLKDSAVIKALKQRPFKATTDFSLIGEVSTIVICVPTPVNENYLPDLSPVISATSSVARFLKKGQLVILESTVNPGVSEEVVLPILEKESGLKAGKDFLFAYCPERVNPGDSKWHVENIPRVIGGFNEKSLRQGIAFYRSIITSEIMPMGSLKEAEAVKIVENTFRDINIAFVNELAMSFTELGIDVVNVIRGAATKPFAFMPHYPGCGVGGHCIPVDPYYLIERAKKEGFYHDFLSLARRINNHMPEFAAELMLKAMNEAKRPLKGAKIVVLGLAYKPEIDDCRESPAFEIIKALKKYGASVVAYDPHVLDRSDVKTLDGALKGADGALIATAHKVFRELLPKDFVKRGVRVIVDGRNCLPKEAYVKAGIVYYGIGRAAAY